MVVSPPPPHPRCRRLHGVALGVLIMVSFIHLFPRNVQLDEFLKSIQGPSPHHQSAAAAATAPLFDLETFLSTFQAANPKFTDDCIAYLRSPQEYNRERNDNINWRWHFSQYNQDWFMFVNFFYQYALTGRKGFYVESGTNDWIRVSNTAWYDLCLGWNGICVEPGTMHHHKIRKYRTCHLEKHCLSDKTETILMAGEVPGVAQGTSVGECVRLDSLLDKYNVTTVDLWSLDVEGFEFKAMAGLNWSKYHIQGLLMEQQDVVPEGNPPCVQFPMDYRLTTLGYAKYRLVSDGFYWKNTIRGPLLSEQPNDYYQQQPQQQPQQQHNPLVPNVTALDEWFRELERGRCKIPKRKSLQFFTDPSSSSSSNSNK